MSCDIGMFADCVCFELGCPLRFAKNRNCSSRCDYVSLSLLLSLYLDAADTSCRTFIWDGDRFLETRQLASVCNLFWNSGEPLSFLDRIYLFGNVRS